ncbi:MAG: hypothetical protein PUG16_02770 [Lachnospiraceae bacterium]|jgi:hypothetical protein|nr:hypothetical protein [Lachnospiraceae bacterium]
MTEQGKTEKKQRIRILVYILLLVFFALAFLSFSSGDAGRERATLEKAIREEITAYYAREGTYPSSLSVLKKQYGLTYDQDRFQVNYVLRGSNIRPYVTIVDRGR